MDSSRDSGGVTYLDTASYGLPSIAVREVALQVTRDWASGQAVWLRDWEPLANQCRVLAATILGVDPAGVSLVPTVSVGSAYVAWSLPVGSTVLVAEHEFRSLLYPFLSREQRGDIHVRLVPGGELARRIDQATDLVAVSHVESADGHVNDVEELGTAAHAAGARLFVDATHAAGTLEATYKDADYLAVTAYKWLCSPRGVSFFYAAPSIREELIPLAAGWRASPGYLSGDYFGGPLDLFTDGRGLDVSVAWQAVAAARRALEEIAAIDPGDRFARGHSVVASIADALSIDPPAGNILSVPIGDPNACATAFTHGRVRAGIQTAARRVRISAHYYNTPEDVDAAVSAVQAFVDRSRIKRNCAS